MAISRRLINEPSSQIFEEIAKVMNYPARSFVSHIDRDEVIDDLAKLVSYPSCSFDGYDIEPSLACAAEVKRMVEAAGFTHVEMLDVGGRAPVVWAQHHANAERYPDAPTLLLYAHYDIQPAPIEEQGWESDPFELTLRDNGRYYGRGSADNKAGIVGHLHAIEAAGGLEALGHVNLKICFEGEEECFGTLEDYIATDPHRFEADAFLIFDMGSDEVGRPMLGTALRGTVLVDVEVDTIKQALHSGVYGGPTPDALTGLITMLSTLWDVSGDVAIEGLKSFEWDGAPYLEERFRRDVGLLEGADLVGTGPLHDRIIGRPSATIIGLDATSVAESSNVIVPSAKARISVRFPYGQSTDQVLDAVTTHLKKNAPKGMIMNIVKTSGASAFMTDIDGPLAKRFAESMAEVFDSEVTAVGGGASIPLLASLQEVSPDADFLLYGVSDRELSNMHGGNESVDPGELVNTIKTEATFFKKLEEESVEKP
ncbi:MAG: M20/M25/M40 family metallo-hydrolase [Coriobacteriia bacterium]|nr:M20/M25/M40 family metallo-hydrolase [Coriobacteriia bacterium]